MEARLRALEQQNEELVASQRQLEVEKTRTKQKLREFEYNLSVAVEKKEKLAEKEENYMQKIKLLEEKLLKKREKHRKSILDLQSVLQQNTPQEEIGRMTEVLEKTKMEQSLQIEELKRDLVENTEALREEQALTLELQQQIENMKRQP